MTKEHEKKQIKKAVDSFQEAMIAIGPRDQLGYMAFGISEKTGTGIVFGGRTDLNGIMISHALAEIVYQTPGMPEDFFDVVCDVAKETYHNLLRSGPQAGGDPQ